MNLFIYLFAACGASGGLYFLLEILTGCGCIYSCFYRTKMRKQYMLPESPCGDCLVHCCCECCALCQEYRELKHRGYDMSIGKSDSSFFNIYFKTRLIKFLFLGSIRLNL